MSAHRNSESVAGAGLFDGLFAVVVNWNGELADNLRCLASLVADGVPEERICVVDNGSDNGSREGIDAAHPRLLRIDNGANLGFGEAANQGARLALEHGARAVVFINNDLWLPMGEGTLRVLVEALESDPRLGMVGPRVLFPPDEGEGGATRVWCAGGRLDFRQNLSTLLGNGQPDGPPWTETRDVDYIVGCSVLVRREVLEEVGLFRSRYFAYVEDVELGLRAREAGWGVRVVGAVRAFHAPSSATGGGYGARRKWMQALNSVHFMREHGTPGGWVSFLAFDVATLLPLILWRSLRGEGRPALAKAKGLWDGLRGREVTAEALRPGASRLWP
ncbi:N-acetylglucosaminyl-diphospho-decaprenol L-rhamnosyltransferase [Planctomycetes bacterium Poly30]|uniref:N-acetylglucosaminyl-diphospho-decaprenol L-rhamnosyltransferase n=1 Tax=Saltatorellus ferox TaxID=2528018 RepID=A0A518ERF0_9BACT|nr:N-acetylglucosaminyl-diphospho-decaprenol L-rhamnosyltransferase [Planctomycetes bacterium Poly30]